MPTYSLNAFLQLLADSIVAGIPRRKPDKKALEICRIISHRGEHDNKKIKENTLPAFDLVHAEGIWGIELDIRWTMDLHPVVIHDADCRRVFGSPIEISQYTLAALQAELPQIPSLKQVVNRYGKKMHLMIELKKEPFKDIELQRSRLSEILSGLAPIDDFHFLSLHSTLFELFDIVPSKAMLPVAEFNLNSMSLESVEKQYAGISGQYLLVTNQLIGKHRQLAQKTGSGFIRSRFSFYRELNRDVEWIFTNHAIKLKQIRDRLLDKNQF